MHRTRIKICGLTREGDVMAAVAAGADALGFVFYRQSKRWIAPNAAAVMMAAVPPFVTTVGLFVNATVEEVAATVALVPVSLLQFHGDETPEQCAAAARAVNRPFIAAYRIGPSTTAVNLLEYEVRCRAAGSLFAGLLLDTHVAGYGGGGKVFDWSIIPEELAPRVVLSGGLHALNVTDAVTRVRPHAVDVSSGVESSMPHAAGDPPSTPGIKNADAIQAFVAAVRAGDSLLTR